MAEERVVKSVRMSPDLVARVEAARGDVVWSTWVVRAVEQRLEREGSPPPLDEVGVLLAERDAADARAAKMRELEAEAEYRAAEAARESARRDVAPRVAPRSGHAATCRCGVCKAAG